MKRVGLCCLLAAMAFPFLPGCTKYEVDSRHQVDIAPVEIKPIHITIDVNIKVDRALDDFFGDLDQGTKGSK
ncbi:MAG: hypothetical protein L3J03_04530 [Desulfobacterales bacterium]|nr:hypothetical protein [Desulfobacterales bacterium]